MSETPRYEARSVGWDKGQPDYPLWYVADTTRSGLNVTGPLMRNAALFLPKELACVMAAAANKGDACLADIRAVVAAACALPATG